LIKEKSCVVDQFIKELFLTCIEAEYYFFLLPIDFLLIKEVRQLL